ncbi:Nuclear RNA export factor 1 [Trichuris trichiura]|uniref:Nuclear RNA export factor 1 n=1 Tax=Trichuris trichiura TaxID=36087 RepID=A0A077YZU7_TRITR|nr:Nuclear RNA export factor 1 [Trichuris trichiura]
MADYKQFTKNQGRFRGAGSFNPAALVRSVNDWREKRPVAVSGRANRKGQNDWRHSTYRSRQAVEKHGTWSFLTVKPVSANSAKQVLQSMKELLGNVPFIPLFIKIGGNGVMSFYLKNKTAADTLAACSSSASTKRGKSLSIWKRISKPPFALLDGAQCELMKTVLLRRYDSARQFLNLSNFGEDESFIEYRVNFPINRAAVSIALADILCQNPATLVEIDLSCNALRALDNVANLLFCAPSVTRLDLSGNVITSIEELEKLSSWNLVALSLRDNPVLHSFKLKPQLGSYSCQLIEAFAFSRLLEIFPLLKILDGKEISTETFLPQFGSLSMKGSYVVNEPIKVAIANFLQEYYSVFDGDKKNRVQLMKAYEAEQSLLTISLNNQTNQKNSNICLNKRWKSLIRYNHELLNIESWQYRRDCLEFSGNMSIICFLKERIPEIKHELNSFLVDLAILQENIAVCSITGYFKDPLDTANSVKEFGRVLILEYRPGELIILNDMTYFCGTSIRAYGDQMACLEKLNIQYQQAGSISSAEQQAQGSAAATTPFSNNPNAQEVISKDTMIAEMAKITGMKPTWAAKCLEDNNWQFQLACDNFVNLRDSGVIPPDAFN